MHCFTFIAIGFLPFGNIVIKLEEKLSTLEEVSEVSKTFRLKRKNFWHKRRVIVKRKLRVTSWELPVTSYELKA